MCRASAMVFTEQSSLSLSPFSPLEVVALLGRGWEEYCGYPGRPAYNLCGVAWSHPSPVYRDKFYPLVILRRRDVLCHFGFGLYNCVSDIGEFGSAAPLALGYIRLPTSRALGVVRPSVHRPSSVPRPQQAIPFKAPSLSVSVSVLSHPFGTLHECERGTATSAGSGIGLQDDAPAHAQVELRCSPC